MRAFQLFMLDAIIVLLIVALLSGCDERPPYYPRSIPWSDLVSTYNDPVREPHSPAALMAMSEGK
jgi:hypothetical protein